MNKTTFVEFFSAKINCLAGWAMSGVDVVQHIVLLDYISIFARKNAKNQKSLNNTFIRLFSYYNLKTNKLWK